MPKKDATVLGHSAKSIDPRRSVNVDRLVAALRADGPSSQAVLARRTGLSAATVNAIVRDLRANGTVEIRPLNGREGVVTLVAGSGTFAVLEIAEDHLHAVGFAFDTCQRVDRRIDGVSDPATSLDLLRELSSALGDEGWELDGLAVAIQAPVERGTGAITKWCNSRMPGWADVPLVATFERELGCSVTADNDANLAALAEWTWGSGRGADEFLYVRASTGVGGGILLNGSIYHGGNGMAGDMGHVALEASGEVCYCGSRGCLTTLISERAIVEAVRTSPGQKDTLSDVVAAASAGDAACQRVLAEAGDYLGRAIANAAKVMAPSRVAIGGKLGAAGSLVFDGLLSSVELSNIRAASAAPSFVAGELGEDVAVLGAVAAALNNAGKGLHVLEEWMLAGGTVEAAA